MPRVECDRADVRKIVLLAISWILIAVIYDQALTGLALTKSDPRFGRRPAEPEQESMALFRRPSDQRSPQHSGPLGTVLMERPG